MRTVLPSLFRSTQSQILKTNLLVITNFEGKLNVIWQKKFNLSIFPHFLNSKKVCKLILVKKNLLKSMQIGQNGLQVLWNA